ncbi:site-specific recombinase XerD [Hydrogenispora ethanolica]|uniref:Site-specific recombinase XerD n=1 Tax=Hydrogenispora ethanolica TaxID=1082276 RepID=A0A4R1RZU8_HYDET|nr:tyrosine-type recombinase/integrase [Hydrogenispora ethanolica]TCL72338.1 site-specific recombinase XerD [Hydrogenispora ethanolica]
MERVRSIKQKNLTFEEVYDRFILFKQSQGLADRTINDYRYHISNLFKTKNVDLKDIENLRFEIQKYFVSSSKLSAITFNSRRKSLKCFFSWLLEQGYILENPMDEIKKRKEDEQPRAVNEVTLQELLRLPNLKTFGGLRDYSLIIFTMDTGIRPSEAFGLTIKEFNLKSFEVHIPAEIAKTRISRTLPLNVTTVDVVKKLHSVRHPSWRDNVPLFCTEVGTPLTRFSWSRRLRKYSEKLGVSVTPYSLRHSFGTIFLRLGGNAFNLQKLMGHTTLTMTRRYITLTEKDLHQQHSLASPINILVTRKNRVRKI